MRRVNFEPTKVPNIFRAVVLNENDTPYRLVTGERWTQGGKTRMPVL
jgi:hypothetical protein